MTDLVISSFPAVASSTIASGAGGRGLSRGYLLGVRKYSRRGGDNRTIRRIGDQGNACKPSHGSSGASGRIFRRRLIYRPAASPHPVQNRGAQFNQSGVVIAVSGFMHDKPGGFYGVAGIEHAAVEMID